MVAIVGIPGPQGPVGVAPRGAWSVSTTYASNDFTTDDGSAWLALKANTGVKPGSDPETWTLYVKSGDLSDAAQASIAAGIATAQNAATAAGGSASAAAASATQAEAEVAAAAAAVQDGVTAAAGSASAAAQSATAAAQSVNDAAAAGTAAGTAAANAATAALSGTVTTNTTNIATLTASDAATRLVVPFLPNGKGTVNMPQGYYNFKNNNLNRARRARGLAVAGFSNFVVAVVGDSNRSGHGAGINQTVETTGYLNARNWNYINTLSRLLNNGNPVGEMLAGTENLTLAQWAFPFDSRVTIGAGWTQGTTLNPSVGGYLWTHASTNTDVTPISFAPKIPYNQVDVWTVANGAGLSDLTVAQAGTTLGTVSETAATPVYQKTTFSPAALSTGVLTVAPATASKTAYLSQLITRDTTRVGTEVYEWAFDGGRAVANYNFSGQVWEHAAAAKTVAPHLIILELGINDINQAATADAFAAAMSTLITSYKVNSDVIVEWSFPIVVGADGGTNNTLARNAAFQAALYNLADTLNFPIINHTLRMGGVSNWAALNTAGLTFDNNHMKAGGYADEAIGAAFAIQHLM